MVFRSLIFLLIIHLYKTTFRTLKMCPGRLVTLETLLYHGGTNYFSSMFPSYKTTFTAVRKWYGRPLVDGLTGGLVRGIILYR